MSGSRLRRRLSVALVAVTALLAAAAAVSGYARSQIVDADSFSVRAESALDEPAVREAIADRVVDQLAQSVVPDALVVRPLVVSALATVANSSKFRRLFERTVRERHNALFDGEGSFTLSLLAGAGTVAEALRSLSPRLANAIPPGLTAPVIALHPRDFELRAAGWLRTLADWWWPLLALTLLAAVATGWLAGSPRAALVNLGIAATGAGVAVAVAVAGLGAFVLTHISHAVDVSDETERQALRAIWSALFGDLRTAGILGAAGGAAVALLASGRLTGELLAAAWARLRAAARAQSPAARFGQAAALVAAGLLLLLEPGLAVRALGVVAGAVLLLVGAARLTGRAPEARAAASSGGSASPVLLSGAVVGVIAVVALAVALVLPGPSAAPPPRAPAGACNGSVELCDKLLNEVVFPSTHNSYAAADEPGWFFANQRHGIAQQLRDGIRGFLIDIHYGVADPDTGRVRTDLAYEGSSRNKVARQLSPEALEAADRLAGRVGAANLDELPGSRGVYLCHTLCELGAEPLDDQFAIFRGYLDDHPRAVLVLFIEPYVPVEQIERSLERTDLLGYAAVLRRDRPLPTLRRLIRSGQRLVIFAEEDGGARPWYLDGFSFVQDTPLGATSSREFSCRRYRGSPDSPMLLLNHWIDTFPPSPRRNQRVGGRVLERRIARCERERRMLPNLVAVDFYERTGVVDIAARMNEGQ